LGTGRALRWLPDDKARLRALEGLEKKVQQVKKVRERKAKKGS
jgi:hypothetical protein